MMQKPATRTWLVEEDIDPDTGQALGVYDRQEAHALLADLEAVLYRVGGVLNVAADRVRVGEVGGQPVYESRGLVVQWKAFAPAREDDRAAEDDDEPEDEG